MTPRSRKYFEEKKRYKLISLWSERLFSKGIMTDGKDVTFQRKPVVVESFLPTIQDRLQDLKTQYESLGCRSEIVGTTLNVFAPPTVTCATITAGFNFSTE